MPSSFPCKELTEFMKVARQILLGKTTPSIWKEFAGGSNLIGWRFRAASEYWQECRDLWPCDGDKNSHEDNFNWERCLYGTFSSAVSCVESAIYCIAALFSDKSLVGFTFGPKEQRTCNPKSLANWIRATRECCNLTTAVDSVVTADEWKRLVELRNRMTHRSNLPRVQNLSVGGPRPAPKPIHFASTSSTTEIEAELEEFDKLFSWLAETIRNLLSKGQSAAESLASR